MDEDSPLDVRIIEIGRPEWPRWMIYHRTHKCYWNKGRWRRRRRDGEVWYLKAEARAEMNYAAIDWDHIVIEDDDEE